MGKLINTDEFMEWVSSWFEWNSRWYPYSKSNDIPITELKYFLDQMDGVEAEPVKHGRWIGKSLDDSLPKCSVCGNVRWGGSLDFCMKFIPYCERCGAKMDENIWEEPEINPCRGCEDYDGKGGCKSNGGCGVRMDGKEDFYD